VNTVPQAEGQDFAGGFAVVLADLVLPDVAVLAPDDLPSRDAPREGREAAAEFPVREDVTLDDF
jgi:hypothetical protein